VQLRMVVLPVVAWACTAALGLSPRASINAAIGVSTLLFSAGHLPAAFRVFGSNAVTVARTMILNSIASVPFCVLFVEHGLEHSMVAHFTTDLVLHVLPPLISSALAMRF